MFSTYEHIAMHMSPAHFGPAIYLPVYAEAVRAGFPSLAGDHLDAPIDLSRTQIWNALRLA